MEMFLEICRRLKSKGKLTINSLSAELSTYEALRNFKDPEARYKVSAI